MATRKNTSKNTSDAVAALRSSLEALGIYTDEEIDKQVAKVQVQLREPARKRLNDALIDSVGKLLSLKTHEKDIELMCNGFLSIHVAYNAEGERTITARAVKKASASRSGNGGKRPTLLVDGNTYANYAELCKHYSIDVGGDSARRRYTAMSAKDAAAYPPVAEVEPATPATA